MAGTHVGRGNSNPLRIPPEIGQLPHDSGGCALFESPFGFVHSGGGGSSDACDVLQKEPLRAAITGDAQDLEEKPGSGAVKACAQAGNRQVLARESRNDAIHGSSPSSSVEGANVAPDRSRIQAAFLNARRQDCGRVSLPLNVADGAILDAQVSEPGSQSFSEHADTGKQFDGMKIHVISPSRPFWRCNRR